jgi:hypothetical protein
MSILLPNEGFFHSGEDVAVEFNYKHRHLGYTYRNRIELKVSKDLCELMHELSYNVIKNKPDDIYDFLHRYCENLLKQRREKKNKEYLNDISHITCSSCSFESTGGDCADSADSLLFSKETDEVISFRQRVIDFLKAECNKDDFDESKMTSLEIQMIEYLICTFDENQMQILSEYILNDEHELQVMKWFKNIELCKDDDIDRNENILVLFKKNLLKYLKNY